MTEKEFWKKIQKGLGKLIDTAKGRMDRVENGVCDGMPDVSITSGSIDVWVELKYVAKWPQRANTRVLGDRGLRPEQINWHLRHVRAGGKCFVLVGVGREMYLADGSQAKEINGWTFQDWMKSSRRVENFEDLYVKLFTKYV